MGTDTGVAGSMGKLGSIKALLLVPLVGAICSHTGKMTPGRVPKEGDMEALSLQAGVLRPISQACPCAQEDVLGLAGQQCRDKTVTLLPSCCLQE